MTNTQKVLNELQRDYTGTMHAWYDVCREMVSGLDPMVEKALVDRANELRESMVGMHHMMDMLQSGAIAR